MKKSNCSYFSFCIILSFLFLSTSIQAQLEISPGNQNPWTPENLIENVFLGEGVEVSSIIHNGEAVSVGYFQGGEDAFGIDRGIVLSTGEAINTLGPNNDEGNNGGLNGNDDTCLELEALTNFTLNDVSAYEITFIPVSDTLRFRYVFASEEYPEYACSGFNDVFGFFISGPNPDGGNYVAENIALTPDLSDPTGLTFTDIPVAINNINGGVGANGSTANCTPPAGSLAFGSYYNNNPPGSTTMQYDGYLDVFTAQAIVTPCEPYTIKLAVADAGDSNFDTAVFLEAKSFGTGKLEVTAQTVSLDGTLVEGCANGELCFTVPNLVEEDYVLDYNLIGTAINGVDYESIPLDLFIPAGDSTVCYPIIPIVDGLEEMGKDSIGIDIQIDPCTRDTFWVTIQDPQLNDPELPDDITICEGDSASINYDITLGVPIPEPPTFTNNTPTLIAPTNTAVFSDMFVSGVFPLQFQEGVLKSICIDSLTHFWVDDLDIFLFSPSGQFIELTTDNGANGMNYINTCFTPVATNPINDGPGGFAPASAAPFTGEFAPEGIFSDLYGGDTNGAWRLFLQDDTNFFNGTLHSWTMCFEPLYKLSYSWSPSAGLSCDDCAEPLASPQTTTTYTLTVTDTYGCSATDEITIFVDELLPAPTVSCGTTNSNSITFNWTEVTDATGYQVNIDDQGWIPANGTLSHIVSGLTLNQSVTLQVQAIGDCPGEIGSETCMTPDCPAPTGNVSNIMNVDCFGEMSGSATVTAIGANPPFTFSMGGDIDADGIFTDLAAGDYEVLINDNVNCAINVNFTITQPDSLQATAVVIDSISCNGLSDGEGTFIVEGGTAPYSFDWSTSAMDSIATDLVVGQNTVVITDAIGCQITETIEITQPEVLAATIAADSINCFGETNGQAVVTPTGGTAGYTYMWSNSETTATANNLSAQTYTVEVTDANGCETIASVDIEEYDAIDLSITTSTPATCDGVEDGTATVTPSGGAGNYTYEWQDADNQNTATAVDLTVGTYTVIVTDQLNCTASTTVSISSPNAITAGYISSPALCFDSSDGEVTVTVLGGTPDPNLSEGYTFDWSVAGGVDNVHSDLPAGDHVVTITDVNGCFLEFDVEVLAPSEIQLDMSANSVNCASGTDGEVSVTAMGGAGGFMYTWSDGATPNNSMTAGLSAGWAYVTVEDANGCTAIDSVEVTAPDAITLITDTAPVNCFGESNGTASVVASNGAGGFTYQWNDDDNQTDATAIDLAMGTYTVMVTDANLCTATAQVQVIEPDLLTTMISGNDANCFGEANGNSTVTPSGGTGDYMYQWSDGSTPTTPTANDLAAQITPYYVTVTDGNGCTAVDSIIINSPSEMTALVAGTNNDCFGDLEGSATVTPMGGSGNYNYTWNDPTNQTGITASNLAAGDYQVTISDDNNCSIVESISITQPTQIVIFDDNVTNVDCNGNNTGAISLDVQGGEGMYQYNWSNGSGVQDLDNIPAGTYTLSVTDQNLCEVIQTFTIEEPPVFEVSFNQNNVGCFMGSDGNIDVTISGGATGGYSVVWSGPNGFTSTDEDLNNLPAGQYVILATDANNCTATQSVSITQPSTGVMTSISDPVTICFGATDGTATVSATGGTPPYDYLWNDPNNQITSTATNLPPGNFTVTVTDQSGCTFTEVALVEEQSEISISLSQTSALCFNGNDGTATIDNIIHGNMPAPLSGFDIVWNTSPAQTGSNIVGLQGGNTYQVTVTDNLGCTASASIEIGNPAAVSSTITNSTDVVCYGGNDGEATAEGAGGVTPYDYFWSVNANSQLTATATDLAEGNYIVTISDANGCTTTNSVSIAAPQELEITDFSVRNVECFGENTGTLSSQVQGGNSPYSYSWSNGDNTNDINNLFAGNYDLTVTDANGCTTINSIEIRQPAQALTATTDTEDVTCNGGFDGQIFFFPSGGTQPYTYSSDGINFNGSPTQIGLPAEQYDNVAIRDANGCEIQLPTLFIQEPPAVEVDLGPDVTINYGEPFLLNPVVTNAAGPVDYRWSPFDDHIFCDACPAPVVVDSLDTQTTYQVMVTDSNGCTAEDLMTIFVRKFREVLVPTGFSPNGDGNINDLLIVHGRPGSTVKLFRVFDRWGELVYENRDYEINDPTVGWDGTFKGKSMNPAVYVWYAEVEFEDGEVLLFKGQTTLIR